MSKRDWSAIMAARRADPEKAEALRAANRAHVAAYARRRNERDARIVALFDQLARLPDRETQRLAQEGLREMRRTARTSEAKPSSPKPAAQPSQELNKALRLLMRQS